MITRQDAISKFKEILGASPEWERLKSSQFVEHLATFSSWLLRSLLFAIERVKQEFFASTALNRASILAHIEDKDYLPRRATPSTGTIAITNNGANTVTLPVDQAFVSGAQVSYLTDGALEIAAGATETVTVRQAVKHSVVSTVEVEQAFHEVLFTSENSSKVTSIAVKVDEGAGPVSWTKYRLLQNAFDDTLAFDEFYSHNDQLGVRFGNGSYGKMPEAGAEIEITTELTEGATFLISGQPLFAMGEVLDDIGESANLTVLSQTELTGGQSPEGTEELKKNLHYWPIYNEKLVWKDDYEYFLKRTFPGITWLNVWGEQEQEAQSGADVDNINKIFVSAYGPELPTLSTDAIDSLEEVGLMQRRYQWTAPVFSTFSLAVTGKVHRSKVIATVIADITAVLTENFGKDSADRKSEALTKDFFRLITATGHFDESTGGHFDIVVSGTVTPSLLEEMVHIDMAATTFDVTYL